MIPNDFIDELLQRTDIVDVVQEYVALKKSGANYQACCPFHKEKTPSFTVAPNKQFYHCFGCGAHGTAIGFLMEYANMDFPDAVGHLAARAGMQMPRTRENLSPQQIQERQAHKDRAKIVQETLAQCAAFYAENLAQSPAAQAYVRQRGLSADICRRFGLGFAPEAWQALAQCIRPYPSDALQQAGMISEKDGRFYDRFRNRLMFPIKNAQGTVIGFGGRVIGAGEPKYLNSPETGLFHKGRELYGLFEARAAIREAGRVLVVEGYMDVVALAQNGIAYAVAALGTATTADHLRLLLRESGQIFFCFDGDSAGRKAAWRALENALPLLKDNTAVHFLFLPPEHDPDSYVRTFGREAFENLQNSASVPLSRYWLDELLRRHNPQTEEGKAALIHAAAPMLADIQAAALKFLLSKNLADAVGVDVADLQHLTRQKLPEKPASYRRPRFPAQSLRQPAQSSPAAKQIRRLLINPQWAIYVDLPEYLLLTEEQTALAELAAHIRSLKNSPSAALLWETLRDSPHAALLHKIFAENALQPETALINDSEEALNEFKDGMAKLRAEIRRRQIDELLEKSAQGNLSRSEQDLLKTLLQR